MENPVLPEYIVLRHAIDPYQAWLEPIMRHYPHKLTESVMKDIDIKTNILEEMEFDPRVTPTHIGVTVEQGIASIYGHVRSFTERMAAENATRRVHGVRAIANEIDVNLPGDAVVPDSEIARKALRILQWDSSVESAPISIRVQAGQVELDGDVMNLFQKRRAEDLMHRLPGIRGVFNHLHVKPRPTKRDLKPRIEAALKRQAVREASKIKISVEEGDVQLSGTVGTLAEKEAIAETASAAQGVRRIINKIKVGD